MVIGEDDAWNEAALCFSGQHFGILKADFIVLALTHPEDVKDQFLSEVRLLPNSNFD